MDYKKILHRLKKKYKFRENEITGVISATNLTTICNRLKGWQAMDLKALHGELLINGCDISKDKLLSLLALFSIKKYNPLKDYIESQICPNNPLDYLNKTAGHLVCEDDNLQTELNNQFIKFMVRLIATIYDPNKVNKHAFILLSKKQQIGKSTFFDWLCPPNLKNYYTPALHGSPNKWMQLKAINYLLNIDELANLNLKAGNVKALMSQNIVQIWVAFKNKTTTHSSVASFVGSANYADGVPMFKDNTGTCRFITFKVKSINHNYNTKKGINIGEVYASAHSLYLAGFDGIPTSEELILNEKRNSSLICKKAVKQWNFTKKTQEKAFENTSVLPINSEKSPTLNTIKKQSRLLRYAKIAVAGTGGVFLSLCCAEFGLNKFYVI